MNKSLNLIQNEFKELPNNIEAEQSVIGSILTQNEIFDEITGIISDKNFFDPLHQKIFGSIQNGLAMPITSHASLFNALFIPLVLLNPPVTIRGPLNTDLISFA